jgi:hypothetical protein
MSNPHVVLGSVRRLDCVVVNPRLLKVSVRYVCGGPTGTSNMCQNKPEREVEYILICVIPRTYIGHIRQSQTAFQIILIVKPSRLCISDLVGSSRKTLHQVSVRQGYHE